MGYLNRIDRRVPVVTPGKEFIHLVQAIQEAYNDFKREVNQDSPAGYTILPHINNTRSKQAQPDRTPPCRIGG
jgi:hypothetical protein